MKQSLPLSLKVAIVFALLLSFCIIVIFTVNFWGHPRSPNIEQWGQTGDYFGGMLNPVLSFASILVTIFIAREVQSLNVQQLQQQSRLLKQQLQFQALSAYVKEFNDQLQCVLSAKKQAISPTKFRKNVSLEDVQDELTRLRNIVVAFNNNYLFLFDAAKSAPAELSRLIGLIEKWSKTDNVINQAQHLDVSNKQIEIVSIFYTEIFNIHGPATPVTL